MPRAENPRGRRLRTVVGCLGGYAEDVGWSSHWTFGGQPVACIEFIKEWEPASEPPAYRPLYERSLAAASLRDRAAATLAVERIAGDVVLVVGGDDRVWPSAVFARQIAARRAAAGKVTTTISHPDAGHRVVLPGEQIVAGGADMARGGSAVADAALGQRAWPPVLAAVSRSEYR